MRLISEKRGQPPEYDPPRVIEVRDAVREDAPAACEVIRRSISELCEADHRNDPEILRRWLANKTPEIVGSWIIKPGNSVLVTVDDDSVSLQWARLPTRVRSLSTMYLPDARFRGVSRAMLTALEARALERGIDRCTPSQYRNGSSLLPIRWVYPGRRSTAENLAPRRATRCRSDSPDNRDRGQR
jgi:hypothetical protein